MPSQSLFTKHAMLLNQPNYTTSAIMKQVDAYKQTFNTSTEESYVTKSACLFIHNTSKEVITDSDEIFWNCGVSPN